MRHALASHPRHRRVHAAAGEYLRADPVRNTVPLSVLEALLASGLAAYGDAPPVFGWHVSAGGSTDGAVLQTPPHPLLVGGFPPGSAADLIRALGDRRRPREREHDR